MPKQNKQFLDNPEHTIDGLKDSVGRNTSEIAELKDLFQILKSAKGKLFW